MRSEKEMMDLILNKAREDDRVRACFLNGSRANANATHDKYCDYDVVYVVNDIRSFTNDEKWIDYFGEMLILQKSTDWFTHPYDYSGTECFAYLMQFMDGNRIDLTLVDVARILEVNEEVQPRIILLDKDGRKDLYDIHAGEIFYVQKPTAKEYFDTCNEFWWLAVNVAKGICREEFGFVKIFMEHYEMEMFHKMLSWKIGIDYDFEISVGKCNKYLKRYLSEEEMKRVMNVYPGGDFQDIKEKLYAIFDYFEELSQGVANYFGFEHKNDEVRKVRNHVTKMLSSTYSSI